jgi:hypothetical protein
LAPPTVPDINDRHTLEEAMNPSTPASRRAPRWALTPVLLGLLLAGCVSGPAGTSRVLSGAGSLASSVAAAANTSTGRAAVGAAANTVAPEPAPAEPAAQAPAADASRAAPTSLRSAVTLQGLFAKGTVNGAELLTELIAVRTLMRDQRSAAAVGALLGPPLPAGSPAAADPTAMALKLAMDKTEDLIKPYVASIGFGALDLHLKTMIEDPTLLGSERIKLPSPRNMTQAQMQRVINMAAILVATRVTAKILKKAQEDFANVEGDYTRLITRREAAAQVLYGVLTQAGAGGAPQLAGMYSDDDWRYLRDNVGRMSIKDFANDLGAQNLALNHLRQTDPKAWADYKARSDGLLSVTKGYIRTTAGVTAFAALLANFGNETIGAIQKNKGADILGAMPLAWEFIKEVPPVLRSAWQVGAAGVIELPMKANKRFRVVEGAAATDLARAGDVFAAMKKKGAEPLFNEALFRTGNDGLLYKLYRCDKSEVGRMLDVAVPMAEREKFAARVLPKDAVRFSFANAFNAPGDSSRAQELGDELLRRDHRERTDAVNGVALGEAQRAATKGAGNWNNDQLLRLILANREGVAAHATLQLGDLLVRPVPSMQSVYAYESLIDECAQQFGGGPRAAAASTNAPVAVPASVTTPAAQTGARGRSASPPAAKPANPKAPAPKSN